MNEFLRREILNVLFDGTNMQGVVILFILLIVLTFNNNSVSAYVPQLFLCAPLHV